MSKRAIPILITQPGEIYRLRAREKKQTPRAICSICRGPTFKVRIDRGQQKKPIKKRGRPKENGIQQRPRYELIGYWCETCGLFYYLDGRTEKAAKK
jgi:ssDNA-binding Zn-finger/Zn-ribbon topoisomerase 1